MLYPSMNGARTSRMRKSKSLSQGLLLALAVLHDRTFHHFDILVNINGLNETTLWLPSELCTKFQLLGKYIVGGVGVLPVVRVNGSHGRVSREVEWAEDTFDLVDEG